MHPLSMQVNVYGRQRGAHCQRLRGQNEKANTHHNGRQNQFVCLKCRLCTRRHLNCLFVIRTITPCCWDRVRRRTMNGALLVSMLSIMGAGNGIMCVIAPSQNLVVCAPTHVYMRFVYAHARARVCAHARVHAFLCTHTHVRVCV